MTISLKMVTRKDTQLLTELLTKAFNADTEYYFGEGETGGPPGYDDGCLANKMIESESLKSFMICKKDKKVGCISVDVYLREVAYFCIHPDYHHQGIGTSVWQQMEEIYGENEWLVETPDYSLKNHAFYEKLGFKKIGEKAYSSTAKSFVFEKIDRTKLTRETVKKLVQNQPDFMRLLEIVDDLSLRDGWIVAGTLRNYLWNVLSKDNNLDFMTDIDVAFYDKNVAYEKNQDIQDELIGQYPEFNWEVKNQVYMHGHNPNTSNYRSTRDAVYHYPEKCTSVAIRLNQGQLDVFCPYGLEDIEKFRVVPTPYTLLDAQRAMLYNKRQENKKWKETFPKLTIISASAEE